MSGKLCPSRSTVYVSNLPFSLTNNDIHKLLEKYGTIVKVTLVKDKESHRSKGVAFVLFLEKESAQKCTQELNRKQLFGRTIKCSIAKDNGRTTEFIRRKYYTDKSRCYECGELGHLSYNCPNNMLGDREPPPKKEKKRKKFDSQYQESEEDESDEGEDPKAESLSAAIKYQQEKIEEEDYRIKVASGEYNQSSFSEARKKKFKKSDYFSDEEEIED